MGWDGVRWGDLRGVNDISEVSRSSDPFLRRGEALFFFQLFRDKNLIHAGKKLMGLRYPILFVRFTNDH